MKAWVKNDAGSMIPLFRLPDADYRLRLLGYEFCCISGVSLADKLRVRPKLRPTPIPLDHAAGRETVYYYSQ